MSTATYATYIMEKRRPKRLRQQGIKARAPAMLDYVLMNVTPIPIIGDKRPSEMGSGNVLLNLILFDTAVHIT